ncbi:MAG: PBECR2 nuclease fold domain-containing protein [Gammaproteobacteria bacterium]|nr:PBECR2 nuclease fold domain-containing protein [Gammaproteobacteria bacterium]
MRQKKTGKAGAVDALAKALFGDKAMRTVKTPIEDVVINRQRLEHIAEDRAAGREQYAGFILPTLENPDEVWLVFYPEYRSCRKRYLKVFAGKDYKFMAIVCENAGGGSLTTFFKTGWSYMDKQRQGVLLYKKKMK